MTNTGRQSSLLISESTLLRLFASAVALSASEVLHTSTTPYGSLSSQRHFGSYRQRAMRRTTSLTRAASVAQVAGLRTVRRSRLWRHGAIALNLLLEG